MLYLKAPERCLAILFFAALVSQAQPVIVNDGTGIVNAASYAAQGLPNSSVAQGSIFTIFGSGLGPTPGVEVPAYPLAPSLAGVSIAISQGAATVAAIPLYVSASQINAIMPSNAPLGADNIVVTFNGQTSIPCTGCQVMTVQVAPASFGIFSIDEAGSGQGVFTNGENELISYTHSATAGEVLNIWGTGLGASPGNDTEPPVVGNIGVVPVVYVGGVEVPAAYHGRSGCCSGLDQVQFQVPSNIAGCNVPVALQIGNVVSNFVSIAIAANDNGCSMVNGMAAPDFASLAAQGAITTGYAGISRTISTQTQTQEFFPMTTGSVTTTEDYGYANFEKYNYASFSLTELPLQILNSGACSVYTFNPGQNAGPPFEVATPTVNVLPGIGLDAGATISMNGPNGEKQIAPVPSSQASVGSYGAELGISVGSPSLYLTPGAYTIEGMGGKDVRPFNTVLQMPQGLTWTNQSSLSTIMRSNEVTLTWSGVDPGEYVIISGVSLGINGGGAGFNCTTSASADQFEVPPIVLLALPPSGVNESDGILIPEGSLSVGLATQPVSLNAPGLDIGQAVSSFTISQSVTYQ